MKNRKHRRPDRLHLLPVVLDMVTNRTWFSARQIADAVYCGRGAPHAKQFAAVSKQLDQYVQDGVLLRNEDIAACTLYSFAGCCLSRPKGNLLNYYAYTWPPSWPEESLTALLDVYDDLDGLVPRSPDTRLYLPDGRLPVSPRVVRPDGPYPASDLPEPGCTAPPRRSCWHTKLANWFPCMMRPGAN